MMMRYLTIVGSVCLVSSATLAQDISKITCSFRSEPFEGGKSNAVSCSGSPEKAFSSALHRQPASEMCSQKPNDYPSEYKEYVADLSEKMVTYVEVTSVADFAKAGYSQYLVSKGKSQEEANADANQVRSIAWATKISGLNMGVRRIYVKPSGGIYDPPKELPTYMIRYDNSTLFYTVGVPESMIVEWAGDEANSWTNIRFGRCESEVLD